MKILLIEPVIDLGEAYFSKQSSGQRKYIQCFHEFAFYTYLTLINNYYCVEARINNVIVLRS